MNLPAGWVQIADTMVVRAKHVTAVDTHYQLVYRPQYPAGSEKAQAQVRVHVIGGQTLIPVWISVRDDDDWEEAVAAALERMGPIVVQIDAALKA